MQKKNSRAAQTKKFLTSVVVLLIFLFPLAVSLRWMRDIVFGTDPRQTYSQAEIADFGQHCQDTPANVRPFDEPLVTITFDDGWETIYSQGFEVLEKNCTKSTQYVLGGLFDNQLYLSEDQIASMQQAGHEIASHTMTHANLTTLTEEKLAWELGESDRVLSDKFGDMREFASPLGASNDLVLAHIKKHYRSHRNTAADPSTVGDEDINVRETFDRYNINAYTVRNTTTLEDIRKLIDHTIKRNGWLILTYHQVDTSGEFYAVTPEALGKQLQLVQKSKVSTPTMGQVLDAIGEER